MSGGTAVVGCCVSPPRCGSTYICSTLRSFSGGFGCDCGTAVLKIATNCHSATVCFPPRCGIGLVGAGLWSSYMSSSTACVTASSGDRNGVFFALGRYLSYLIRVMKLSWVCTM